jgi:tetratricopeptide (TPR) repeat protein
MYQFLVRKVRTMSRRCASSSVLVLWCLTTAIIPAYPQTEGTDEARAQQVAGRFLELFEKNPKRGTALDRIYSFQVERGTLDKFVQGYADRAAKAPEDGTSWLILGLLEAQRGQDAAAANALRKAETLLEDNPLPSYYLGQTLVLLGQPDAAVEAFERALARNPARAEVMEIFQALGQVHQRARRTAEALAVWSRLEKLFPDDLRVQEQIASALSEEGQFAEALARYESLARKLRDPYRQVQAKLEVGELKIRLGRTADGLNDFESLLARLNPDSWLYCEVRRKIEEVFLRNDDLAGLSRYYEQWIKKTPDDVDVMSRLGRLLALQGQVAEARRWFDEAVKRAPSRRELRLALIEQLVRQDKLAEAASQYEALAKQDGDNPDTLREWGRLLLRGTSRPEAERKAAAAAVWRKLAAAKATDAVVTAQVADLFRQAGMPEDAIALYKKAIALAPESAQYREYLGEYLHSLKRVDEALATWAEIAAGSRRNVKSLVRLSEILAGFEQLEPAIAAANEAAKLDATELDLHLRLTDLLHRASRYADALAELDIAAKLTEKPEEAEEVLTRQIQNYQAAGILAAQIETLRKDLDAGRDPTAARWLRLGRLLEADRKLADASQALKRSLELDDRSVPAWTASARVTEASGDLLGAANALRKLASLDRRSRTEYLTNVAKLEARLGRRHEALQAGRDLLSAAPGNAEHFQFFADLCFQLGEVDEGLEALRRAVRANPAEPKVLIALAEALARQFRTDEAIELAWRAFARTDDLDNRLNLVTRLAELYIQRNQFDRLVSRLPRELSNPDQKRELTICLAQAYQTSGDYGIARQELERLLGTNPRDTQLLKQLALLAETEGAMADAAKYQQQLNELAPSEEGAARLADFYVKSGDVTEAEAIWQNLSADDKDPHRILQAIDSLIGHAKPEAGLAIAERLLRKSPNSWEALYRAGVALAELGKPDEASKHFQALLDLRLDDDTPSTILQARRRKLSASAPGPAWQQAYQMRRFPLLFRTYAIYEIRSATGLEARNYFGATQSAWAPDDFGESRIAALAWQHVIADRKGQGDAFIKQMREAAERATQDPRPRWNWMYLQLVRDQPRGTYEAARELARSAATDPAAQWCCLNWLGRRNEVPGRFNYRPTEVGVVDTTPPLPDADIDLILAAYRVVRQQKPEWVQPAMLTTVDTELKRARRTRDRDQFYRDASQAANDSQSLVSVLQVAAERGDTEGALALFDRYERVLQAGPMSFYGWAPSGADSLGRAMNALAEAKKHGEILRILDQYMASLRARPPAARRARALASANNTPYYIVWVGRDDRYMVLDFPNPNEHVDHDGIQLLRNAFELFRRDERGEELLTHLGGLAKNGTEAERVDAHLLLSYLRWWREERDEALKELTDAATIRPGDGELRMAQAELREKAGDFAEALQLVDSFEPPDQRMMQRRELLAMRLSVLTGRIDRARQAAERLFGLRLETDIQVQLSDQMHQLGMHELAEAILGRIRRRAGNGTNALLGLMREYARQGRSETAVQVAYQVLRRGTSGVFNPYGGSVYSTDDDAARREAVQTLAQAGKLKAIIERMEAQAQASPHSLPVQRSLAEYYRADAQNDKAKTVYERIFRLQPNDMRLRYQIAMQLIDSGEPAAALDHLRVALRAEPSLLIYRFDEIQKAFQDANRFDDLVNLLGEVDWRALRHPVYVTGVVQKVAKDPTKRKQALSLIRKALDAFPESRLYLLGQIKDAELWQLPEFSKAARDALIPRDSASFTSPWVGFEEVIEYNDDGRLVGVVTRVLDVAERENALEPFLRDIEDALGRFPQWSGGRATRALIRTRQGNFGAALSELRQVLGDPRAPISYDARLILAPELENYAATAAIALELYDGAAREAASNQIEYILFHPVRRIAELYARLGRAPEARRMLVRFADKKITRFPSEVNNARVSFQNSIVVAALLAKLGYPADAAAIYQRLIGNREGIDIIQAFYGQFTTNGEALNLIREVRDLSNRSLRQTDSRALARAARGFVGSKSNQAPEAPAVDLLLTIDPPTLDRTRIRSYLGELLGSSDRSQITQARDIFQKLHDTVPTDLSALIALTLLANDLEQPAAFSEALARLTRWVDETPLSPLADGEQPSARQASEAAPQVGLWLVARDAHRTAATRPFAEKLADRAVEAARRQPDAAWLFAILRERGQLALEQGNRETAEMMWRTMLDRILSPAATGAPADAKSAAVITPERFQQAARISLLASRHGMTSLALRAIRESLRGGPPVQALKLLDARSQARRNSNTAAEDRASASQDVEAALSELDFIWRRSNVPAQPVYETLRDCVLPDARPEEIFLYECPFSREGIEHPRSVGALLVEWAIRAGQADDLRRRIQTRRERAKTTVPASVLSGLLALARRETAGVQAALASLTTEIPKSTTHLDAEFACHLTLPALQSSDTRASAVPLAEAVLRALSGALGEEPMAGLTLMLAREYFTNDRLDDCRAAIRQYQTVLDRSLGKLSGDAALVRRKENCIKAARQQLRFGLLPEALATLGQFADATAPRKGDPPLGDVMAVLADRLRALPTRERYERLKGWSVSPDNRKTIRILASFVAEVRPPAAFTSPKATVTGAHSTHGVENTAELLIDAAREIGTLDGLLSELEIASSERVAHAQTLLLLGQIAHGSKRDIKPSLKLLAAEISEKIPQDPETTPTPIDMDHYLIARACLRSTDDDLRTIGVAMSGQLINHAAKIQDRAMRAHLRRDLAESGLSHTGQVDPERLRELGLALWHPSSISTTARLARGEPDAWWVEDQGRVRHITGMDHDFLTFAYPLTGTFEFSVDVAHDDGHQGELAYGGLVFEPRRPKPVTNPSNVFRFVGIADEARTAAGVWPIGREELLPMWCRSLKREGANRLTVQVSPKTVRALVNGQVFFADNNLSPTSPWIALHAAGDHQATFENLRLRGMPVIPRQLRLSHGNRLDGWVASFFDELIPPRLNPGPTVPPDRVLGLNSAPNLIEAPRVEDYDWYASDGTIRGRRNPDMAPFASAPSRLYYHRRLLDGEELSYEFFYEPDSIIVHPALDRLVFLLEPAGVRLRWLTHDPASHASGLDPENSVTNRAAQLVPRLELRPSAWNTAKLSIHGDRVAVFLNDAKVFERSIEPENQRLFGFYHDKNRTEAQARNVVLTGPWPESLTPAQTAKLAVRSSANSSPAELQARHALFAAASTDTRGAKGGPNPTVTPEGWTLWPAMSRNDGTTEDSDDPAWVYKVPLEGDFEVRGQLPARGDVRLAYGGVGVGVKQNGSRRVSTRDGKDREDVIDPPLKAANGSYAVRLVVKDNTVTVLCNGQPIQTYRLPPKSDPWLVVQTRDTSADVPRELTIEGRPRVPDRVEIKGLAGWLEEPYDGDLDDRARAWEWRGEELRGRLLFDSPGIPQNALVRYHRPLLEDCEVEYEFYFDPDRAMTHPVLGDVVYLIDDRGIIVSQLDRVHDDRYSATPTISKSLTLKANAWNQLKLSLRGEIVRLELNGDAILEQPLEPSQVRTFGLFHFANEAEARVRNISYRGDWKNK